MFTGLVEELGQLKAVSKGADSALLTVKAKKVLEGTKIGDSIAVNGVCLTVTQLLNEDTFTADVMSETLAKTVLGDLKPGEPVNLERALSLGDRLGGHLVSGHVDGIGVINAKRVLDIAIITEIQVTPELIPFILPKGSIAIDGISLTVVETGKDYFTVSLIPLTAKDTTLGYKKPGARVNLETDMLGKYVHRFMQLRDANKKESQINMSFLTEHGFV